MKVCLLLKIYQAESYRAAVTQSTNTYDNNLCQYSLR